MIDSSGKKIVAAEQDVDLDFVLAEIKFFLKGFENEPNDEKALSIAKSIKSFLKANGASTEVMSFTIKLENYSKQTRSDTFVWELVYIRRLHSKYFSKINEKKIAAECRYISAQHFEKICELRPTQYNKCVRILEYIVATNEYENADMTFKNNSILTYAESLFIQIESSVNEDYFTAGMHLYYNLYDDYKTVQKDSERAYESIQRAVKYAWRNYGYRKNVENLQRLCLYYSSYLRCEQFQYKAEENRLRLLISYIKEENSDNALLRRRLATFEDALKKIDDNKNAQSNPQDGE